MDLILKKLSLLNDKEYKEFSAKLIPNINIDITIKAYKVGLDATQVLDDLIKSKDKIQRIIKRA